jgi:Domain of unknown function (DUF1877)
MMSGQGYHFAITDDTLQHLLALTDEMAILDVIENLYEGCDTDSENTAGGYKEWDVLHRCLSDGTFNPSGGDYPLNRCFLGGRLLVAEGSIVNIVVQKEVNDVAQALGKLEKGWFHERFISLFAKDYSPDDDPESDCELFWQMVEDLRNFYWKASSNGRAVVFYTDDPLDYFFRRSE